MRKKIFGCRGCHKCTIVKIKNGYGIVVSRKANIKGRFFLKQLPHGFHVIKGMPVYATIERKFQERYGRASHLRIA